MKIKDLFEKVLVFNHFVTPLIYFGVELQFTLDYEELMAWDVCELGLLLV